MRASAAARSISIVKNWCWAGSALLLGGSLVYPCPAVLQVAAGVMTTYTVFDRLDFVNLNLLINSEERQEALLSQLHQDLLAHPHFANSKLVLGLPQIRYGDQGFLGLLWTHLSLLRWDWQAKFSLDVNYHVNRGERSGFIVTEGVYLRKSRYFFTKIRVRETYPAPQKFSVPASTDRTSL